MVLVLGIVLICGCAHRGESISTPPFPQTAQRIWPVALDGPKRISSAYGEIRPGHDAHTGVDIPAPLGTPVLALVAGVVSFSGAHGNYGNMLVVDHGNGVQTAYAHLAKRAAGAAQAVRKGQVIGAVGKSGNATGPHLHFEVRRNGKRVDPMRYLPAPEK